MSSDQPTLFGPRDPADQQRDPDEGARRRDAGMTRAEQAAEEAFKQHYRETLAAFAATGQEFTSEDVLIAVLEAGFDTRDRRSTGGIVNAAVRSGRIVAVGWKLAERPTLHRCPKRVYLGTGQ